MLWDLAKQGNVEQRRSTDWYDRVAMATLVRTLQNEFMGYNMSGNGAGAENTYVQNLHQRFALGLHQMQK